MKKVLFMLLACAVMTGCNDEPKETQVTAEDVSTTEPAVTTEPTSAEKVLGPSSDFDSSTNQKNSLSWHSYEVPENWTKEQNSGFVVYRASGANLVVQFLKDLPITIEDLNTQQTLISAYAESVNEYELIDSEMINLCGKPAFAFSFSGIGNREAFDTKVVGLAGNGGVITLALYTFEDSAFNYIEDFEKIIDSICDESPLSSDFFADEDRLNVYVDYCNRGKYQELYELAKSHTESAANIGEFDSAYKIMEYLMPILDTYGQCTANYDEFEEKSTITYKNIDSITSDTCFVTSIGTHDASPIITVGFVRSGWIFFDELHIKADEETFYESYRSYEVNTDVLSGGKVKEWVKLSLYDRDIEKLKNATTVTLRFKNSETGDTYDHLLTGDELTAFKVIYKQDRLYNNLDDLRFHYQQFIETTQE